MKPFSPTNKFGIYILGIIQGYNHKKYWRRREFVINPNSKASLLRKLYYLYYIKKVDSRKCCSFGTNLNAGAYFQEPPLLPHGPNGIIVGHDVRIGKNVTIHQQVTIMHTGVKEGTVIGDNVVIGAGAKILPGVKIGHDVKIGANAIVVEDIPPYATVVLQKPRIIIH